MPVEEGAPAASRVAGDSGSAIIDGATHAMVGMLFAGSDAVDRTFGNPVASVLRALKIRIP